MSADAHSLFLAFLSSFLSWSCKITLGFSQAKYLLFFYVEGLWRSPTVSFFFMWVFCNQKSLTSCFVFFLSKQRVPFLPTILTSPARSLHFIIVCNYICIWSMLLACKAGFSWRLKPWQAEYPPLVTVWPERSKGSSVSPWKRSHKITNSAGDCED